MKEIIPQLLAELPEHDRQRLAFCGRRLDGSKGKTQAQLAAQQAEIILDEVTEELCELEGLSETLKNSVKLPESAG
ncbi:hypothetical protein [Microbulbifer sp. TYP-18]|uniref:hypothetical protein n=1 Tax=Microbulbifer sp. TYP-18 TaxID=3230024 RepID=UPI0034C6B208